MRFVIKGARLVLGFFIAAFFTELTLTLLTGHP